MLKNKEIKLLLFLSIFILTATTAVIAIFEYYAGIMAFAGELILIIFYFAFTYFRYQEIAKLSDYLSRVQAGMPSLDIRDMKEGELSILKNNIYKVTCILSDQADLLKRDKKYLADSLADISHQLKTPLTSIMMMTDLLVKDSLSCEKREEFIRRIQSQIKRLEWLVSTLLKLSRIDAGTIHFHPLSFSLKSLIKKACEPLMIPIELKDLHLLIEIPETLKLNLDPAWSAEAIVNILKNCVEHTPKGGQIHIYCEDNPLHTQIFIEDTGDGIEKEDLPYIFQRFYRGKNASSDSVGIGLAMAKSIFINQNATLDVKSEKGVGSCFSIRLLKQVF